MKNKSRPRQLTSNKVFNRKTANPWKCFHGILVRCKPVWSAGLEWTESNPVMIMIPSSHIVRTGHGSLNSVSVTGATAWDPSNVRFIPLDWWADWCAESSCLIPLITIPLASYSFAPSLPFILYLHDLVCEANSALICLRDPRLALN